MPCLGPNGTALGTKDRAVIMPVVRAQGTCQAEAVVAMQRRLSLSGPLHRHARVCGRQGTRSFVQLISL